MKKSALIFLMLSLFSFQSLSTADELVFYNWEDYISEDVIKQFEIETGHSIKILVFDRDNDRDELIARNGAQGIDLAVVDSIATQLFGKHKLLDSLENLYPAYRDHIGSQWQQRCGAFGLPYLWGTLGIVYRKDKVSPPPNSWADLLFPQEKHRQHINMHLDSIDTLVPALKWLGASINSLQTNDLKAAFKLLVEQNKHVTSYEYVVTYNAKTANSGQAHMALAYSGDQQVLEDHNPNISWGYVVPKEGTSIWVDCISILASSTKKQAAVEFLAFVSRPEIAALNAQTLWVATPNIDAYKYLSKDFLNDSTAFPSANTLKNSEFYQQISIDATKIRNRIIHSLGLDQ